ncbi:MAG: hypothetical protein LC792_27785, partial [Actinobacteria bacterium]|nr:hypothetical protein [Actinomycetota bacterium]
RDGCATAAVDPGPVSASGGPRAQAAGQGTTTVSACGDDPGAPPPTDPGPGPGDGDGSLPGDPDGGLPGGDPSGGIGGLVPDGSELAQDLLDRVAQVMPPADDGGAPGGNGGRPAPNPSAGGTTSGSAAVSGVGVGAGAGAEGAAVTVLGTDAERAAPASSGQAAISVGTVPAPGDSLPRTGGTPGSALLRILAFAGLARALVGLARRRQPGVSES